MKRQRKIKGIKLESFKDFILKKGIIVLITVAFLLVSFLLIKAFLYKSDYFRLRSIDIKDAFLDQRTEDSITRQLMSLYGSRNVFRVELKDMAGAIQAAYPDAKDVAARIALPDRVVITMKFRKPVALVRNGRLYPIDEEGFVLPSINPDSLKNLPIIEGVGIRYDEKKGKKSSSGNLKVALDLLREMNRARFMAKYYVETIDAVDARNISFYLKNGPEIRIGCENFRERLTVMEKTLRDPRLIMDRIKYIDLRFRDVVIGPK